MALWLCKILCINKLQAIIVEKLQSVSRILYQRYSTILTLHFINIFLQFRIVHILLFTNFSKLALFKKMDISFFVAMIIIMLEYLPTLPLLRPLGAKNALDYILGA